MDYKKAVEDYFKSDRTLLGGRNLYNKLPGKSLAVQKTMARFTNNPANLEKLYYHLAKTVNLPERNRIILLNKPLVNVKAIEVETETVEALTNEDKLIAFNTETTSYQDAKKLAKALKLTPASQKKLDIFAALTKARVLAVKKK